jgi:uncharacterized membrane protein
LLLSREQAAPLAYIGGSLGTLIGADLLEYIEGSWFAAANSTMLFR